MLLAATQTSTLDVLSKFGPIATALAALVALIIGVGTIVQRHRADRRDQWWKRAQWAFELTLDEDSGRQLVGMRALTYLAASKLAGRDEAKFLEAAHVGRLVDTGGAGDTGSVERGTDDEG